MGLIIVASFTHTNQEPAWQIVVSFQTKGAADKKKQHKYIRAMSPFTVAAGGWYKRASAHRSLECSRVVQRGAQPAGCTALTLLPSVLLHLSHWIFFLIATSTTTLHSHFNVSHSSSFILALSFLKSALILFSFFPLYLYDLICVPRESF